MNKLNGYLTGVIIALVVAVVWLMVENKNLKDKLDMKYQKYCVMEWEKDIYED